METIRRRQHALIAVKSNDIAQTIEESGAMTALQKVLIEGLSLDGTNILINII